MWLRWVLWPRVSHKVTLISKLDWGGSTSSLAHVVVGRIQVLMGCWTDASFLKSCWPEAFLVSLPYGPLLEHLTSWLIAISE